MTRTGQIKIYSPETGCGVIQADDDSSVVLFFRRACVVELYSPAVGDRVSFPATDESKSAASPRRAMR
jgi:cold shock CspA family protein